VNKILLSKKTFWIREGGESNRTYAVINSVTLKKLSAFVKFLTTKVVSSGSDNARAKRGAPLNAGGPQDSSTAAIPLLTFLLLVYVIWAR